MITSAFIFKRIKKGGPEKYVVEPISLKIEKIQPHFELLIHTVRAPVSSTWLTQTLPESNPVQINPFASCSMVVTIVKANVAAKSATSSKHHPFPQFALFLQVVV
jgi:hypothetical protein